MSIGNRSFLGYIHIGLIAVIYNNKNIIIRPFSVFAAIVYIFWSYFLGAAKMKKCSTCKIEKSLDDFYDRKDRKDRKGTQCKICCRKIETKRRNDDIEKHKKYMKEYYLKNIERQKEKKREWRLKNKERRNKNELLRKKNDPNYKLACDLRSSLLIRLRHFKAKKTISAIKLLGCTTDFFIEYIKSKFQEGMTWENHGRHGWHLDHIIPCKFFDLTKEEEQKKCFHYSNFQPLWAGENLSKGAKILGGNFDLVNPNDAG